MGTGGEVDHMKGKLEILKQITPKTAQLLSIFTPLLFFYFRVVANGFSGSPPLIGEGT
jgi:hypothetical protein